jgi:hypothetical protein
MKRVSEERLLGVRLGKARGEHNESGVHPKADLGSICEANAEGNGYFVARGAATVRATCSVQSCTCAQQWPSPVHGDDLLDSALFTRFCSTRTAIRNDPGDRSFSVRNGHKEVLS